MQALLSQPVKLSQFRVAHSGTAAGNPALRDLHFHKKRQKEQARARRSKRERKKKKNYTFYRFFFFFGFNSRVLFIYFSALQPRDLILFVSLDVYVPETQQLEML